jgi:hypothetical protein
VPSIRDYQPPATALRPTDAFSFDRIGVGTQFIEAHNIPLISTVIVDTSGVALQTGVFYAVKTSEGAFTLDLPALSSLTDPAYLDVADIDFNGDVNNITVNAAGSDQIYLYGVLAGSQAVMDVAGEWARFVAEDGVWAMFVGPFETSGSGGTSSTSVASVLDPIEVVAVQPSDNIANPNVTDPSLTAPDYSDQIYRAWQPDGTLAAQSASSFPTLSALRRYPVVGGQTYTVNIANAPLYYALYFTGSPRMAFYDSSHAFTSNLTSFTMVPSVNPRLATFVAPNTGYVGLNVQDSSSGGALPTTQAALDATINAVMLNVGSTGLAFEPYFNGVFAPTDAIFSPPLEGQVVVALQVGYAYVRTACQQSTTTDLCRRIKLGETPSEAVEGVSGSSPGGCIDPAGFRFIPKSTTVAATIGAYNNATPAQSGTDESIAFLINKMPVGGNHGTICTQVTVAAGHGKTNVDVGSIYADGAPINWIIAYIVSSTVLIMEAENPGTATAWSFGPAFPTGLTFTHVSGGTHTGNFNFTAPTETQLIPLNAKYVMELVLDGTVLYTTAYALTAVAGGGNSGNGTVTGSGTPPALAGNYTLTFTSSTAFGVTDPNGASLGTGVLPASTVGSWVLFSAAGITLRVTAGSAPFVNTDTFAITSVQTYSGTDGVYAGAQCAINEVYSILNPASQQTSLINNVGANPPNYQRSDIAEQCRAFYQWTFNPWGAMTNGGSAVNNIQAFNRVAPSSTYPFGDFWAGLQIQRFGLTTDTPPSTATAIQLYIPNTPAPIGGYSFQAFADITTPPADSVLIPIASCGDPTDPPNHFCQRALLSGTVLWSEVYGINPTYALGIPATAIVSKANVAFFTPAQKQYTPQIDYTAGNGVAGVTQMVGTTFRAPFLPTDPMLSVPGVIVDMNGERYCYITAHQSLTRHSVAVPAELNGEAITVIQLAGGMTVNSRVVQNGEILITVTGGYGDAMLQIG